MLGWVSENRELLWWLTAASAVLFVGSLVLAPVLAARIPADYFAGERRPESPLARRHAAVRWAVVVLKNLAGLVLIGAGAAMLVLPGQGLLTIVLGVLLLDFPGKFRFERWLVSRPRVLSAINWVRAKAGRDPLRVGPSAQS
jgi:hypothetical protein